MSSFGLLSKRTRSPVPLRSVDVESTVTGYTAQVVSRSVYENEEENAIEAVFSFPLDESSTVVDFRAEIDERKIIGRVKEKEEAKQEYDDAISSGQSAFLVESERRDIFTISVGNLPPKKKAAVTVTFIMELPTEHDGSVRFNLPSVLTPRYHAASSRPDDATNPTADVTYLPASLIPYTFSFGMRIEADVHSVNSPTHQLSTEYTKDSEGYTVTLVRLAEEHKFDKDVVVTIKPKDAHLPHAVVESGMEGSGTDLLAYPAVTLNYFPDFSTTDAVSELIFVIDRSGSMGGAYITAAKETLMLFLKSIPDDCYFNIIGFGSSFQKLFPQSVPYDQHSLNKAAGHTKRMKADLEGTELLPPLKEIFKMPSVKGLPKQIFVLTDGAISNTYSVIQEVKKNADKARCFSVGIGSGASTELVKGIANGGRGSCEFIKSGERMQPKVMRMLKRALAPSICDVRVDWSLPGDAKAVQSPLKVPPVFSGDRLIIYGFLADLPTSDSALKCTASLKGYIGKDEFDVPIPFDVKSDGGQSEGKAIHQLVAMSLIRDLDNDDDGVGKAVKERMGGSVKSDKEAMVKLSVSANVICKHTAFIAVDAENDEPVAGTMELRHIPMAIAEESLKSKSFFCKKNTRDRRARFSKFESAGPLPLPGGRALGGGGAPPPPAMAMSASAPPPGLAAKKEKRKSSRSRSPAGAMRSGHFSLIVSEQQASGAWSLSVTVANLVRKSVQDLKALSPLKGVSSGVDEFVCWATAIVLAWLERKCADTQDEWELMANKARKWLKKQKGKPGGRVQKQKQRSNEARLRILIFVIVHDTVTLLS
eukprot:m.216437 g.216437  ORF g.216437 m.216437 type:complete len:819 (+) comp39869_c0_seq7:2839-5295(+)